MKFSPVRSLVALSLLVAGLGAIASPAGSSPPAVPRPTGVEITPEGLVNQISAEQLTKDYGVEPEEAARRVALQGDIYALADELAAAVGPESWAGSYIDQANGGTYVALGTDLSRVEAAVARAKPGERGIGIEVRAASRSLRSLEALRIDVVKALSSQGLAVSTKPSIETNSVLLSPVSEGAEAPRVTAEQLAAFAKPYGDAVTIGQPARSPKPRTCSNNYAFCTAPMRGGLTMQASGPGICTTGFYVASATDLKPYILTAGHCDVSSPNFQTRQVDGGAIHPIGAVQNSVTNSVDAAIVKFVNAGGWNPGPYVRVRSSSGTYPTTANDGYTIDQAGQSGDVPGGYMCYTGATSSTRCGQFMGGGRSFENYPTQNMGEINMALCGGDSGAGVYGAHRAYGIAVASPTEYTVASKYYGIGPTFTNIECGSPTYYQGLGTALAATNTALVTN